MSALVEMTQFGVRTNSRTVAEVFEKQHKDVLAALDDLIEKKPELRGRNFTLTEERAKIGAAVRTLRFYEMDRDGFSLVAMGFTGAKALDWKLAYIEAFNRMEATMRIEQAIERVEVEPVDTADAEPAVMRDYSPALAVIREARQIFPPKAVRHLWPRLGLPSPFGAVENGRGLRITDAVGQFLSDCTARRDGERVRGSVLFDLYADWCRATGSSRLSMQAFVRAMEDRGYERIRSNGQWWQDLALTVTRSEIAEGNFAAGRVDRGVLVDGSILAWRDACTVDDANAEVGANVLWQSFCAWCEANDRDGVNQTRFGRALSDMGYLPRKGSKGYALRMGLKLID